MAEDRARARPFVCRWNVRYVFGDNFIDAFDRKCGARAVKPFCRKWLQNKMRAKHWTLQLPMVICVWVAAAITLACSLPSVRDSLALQRVARRRRLRHNGMPNIGRAYYSNRTHGQAAGESIQYAPHTLAPCSVLLDDNGAGFYTCSFGVWNLMVFGMSERHICSAFIWFSATHIFMRESAVRVLAPSFACPLYSHFVHLMRAHSHNCIRVRVVCAKS